LRTVGDLLALVSTDLDFSDHAAMIFTMASAPVPGIRANSLTRAQLWDGVGALIDRAPTVADLQFHGLHLLAAQQFRASGREVPHELLDAERRAAVRTLGVLPLLAKIRAATAATLLLIKGPEVARHYPDAATRDFGDIDILVRDAARVHDDLLDAGFELVGDPELYEGIHHLRPVWVPGSPMAVEIHSAPKWVEAVAAPRFDRLLAFATDSGLVEGFSTLQPEAHAVLLAVHSWAHEPLGRLSQLVDVAAVLALGDRAKAAHIADEWGVAGVWKVTVEALDTLFLDARAALPLRTWARTLQRAQSQTVLESHLSRWMAPLAALGIRGISVVWRNLVDDVMPLPDETWPEKAERTRTAFRNARARRVHHLEELDGARRRNEA
jgi:hypothetical protein